MSKNWKEKHDEIVKNKKDIIKAYNENIPIIKIAKIYKVSEGCISGNLRLWGAVQKHGIKYLLEKMLLRE